MCNGQCPNFKHFRASSVNRTKAGCNSRVQLFLSGKGSLRCRSVLGVPGHTEQPQPANHSCRAVAFKKQWLQGLRNFTTAGKCLRCDSRGGMSDLWPLITADWDPDQVICSFINEAFNHLILYVWTARPLLSHTLPKACGACLLSTFLYPNIAMQIPRTVNRCN